MNKKIRIIPAILTDSREKLDQMLEISASFTDYVQIDIMDGQFVPSTSVSWQDVGQAKTRVEWEVHLMVKDPASALPGYKLAGASRAIFHFEASQDPDSVIATARAFGLGVGLAINPETPVGRIQPLLHKLDSVLILSVHPGFWGAKYLPETLPKVREIKTARSEIEVAIDGGIKESNILEVAASGLDGICVGSAIFLQPDPAASFRRLQSLADSAANST